MRVHEARCSCGQLTATVEGEPVRVSVCHCLACQRRTGSAFGVQARFARSETTISGESRPYTRTSDEGGEQRTFHFCPNCGATVYFEDSSSSETVAFPVGAFADPSFPSPTVSVWEERKHGWVPMPEGIDHIR